MFTQFIAQAESGSIIPDGGSELVVWLAVAAVILGLYFFMKSARKKAAADYWERRRAEQERIANDPDMRKE
jgi:hypothetical protein